MEAGRNDIDRLIALIDQLAWLTTPDGTQSEFDLVTPFANKTGARRYYFPFPLVLPSPEERLALEGLTIYSVVEALASKADISFVSISPLLIDSPFLREGFMEKAELEKLMLWVDEHGAIINSTFNERLADPPKSRFHRYIRGFFKTPFLAAFQMDQWIGN